jgi:hypothetical protein
LSSFQIFVLGAASLAALIALVQPRERPVPNYAWGGFGIILLVTTLLPVILILAILAVAFAFVLGRIRLF